MSLQILNLYFPFIACSYSPWAFSATLAYSFAGTYHVYTLPRGQEYSVGLCRIASFELRLKLFLKYFLCDMGYVISDCGSECLYLLVVAEICPHGCYHRLKMALLLSLASSGTVLGEKYNNGIIV